MWKRIGFFLLGSIATLSVIALSVGFFYLHTVARASSISEVVLVQTAINAYRQSRQLQEMRKTILILGTDQLANRDSKDILTDTIMVVSLDLERGRAVTFSLPRDLYLDAYGVKINKLYEQGVVQEAVSKLTGLRIDYTVVLDARVLGELVDGIGGLDVDIERSFSDERFPKGDVDVRVEKDPKKLYETVTFTKGVERMNGARVMQYIRSRHSADPQEGSDDARVRRQQRVVAALIKQLQDPGIVKRPEDVGNLLALYQRHFASSIPLQDSGALGIFLASQRKIPQLVTHVVTTNPPQKDGLLRHPERHKSGAWVYLLSDPTGETLRMRIREWIGDSQ